MYIYVLLRQAPDGAPELAGWQNGYAEDCKSFDIGSIPVPASIVLFRLSSVVEQSAVNRSVVGSSPTVGANEKELP